MRFVCDSCRAQYMISDDKVGAKGVKVRCKKCGHVILVRKPEPVASLDESTRLVNVNPFASGPEAAPPSTPDGPPVPGESASRSGDGLGALLGGVEDDEIGAVFDQVLKGGPSKPPEEPVSSPGGAPSSASEGDEFDSTRVMSLDAMKQMAQAAEQQLGGAQPNTEEATPSVPTTDWFVAVNDEQMGPLTLDRVKELWDRGEVGAESLCWRAGYPDWLPLSEVKDLTAVLAPRPAKPVIVAPAAVSMPMAAAPSALVESVFSAGRTSTPPRGEVPAVAPPDPTETGSWQPSAASALASLAMQEVEALSKPPPAPAAPAPAPVAGLLDVPPPEPAPALNGKSTFPQMPVSELDSMRQGPMATGYSSASSPYPQQTYDTYRPPSPAPAGKKTALLAVVGGVGLLAVLGGVGFVFLRQQPATGSSPSQPVVAQLEPTQPAPAPTAPAQPTPTAPAQPTQAAPTQQPTQVAEATPTANPPTGSAPAAPGGTAAPGTAPAANPEPAQQNTVAPSEKTDGAAVAKAQPASSKSDSSQSKPDEGSSRKGRKERNEKSDSEREVASLDTSRSRSSGGRSNPDDEFEREFGGGGSNQANRTPGKEKKADSYIPPAPGGGSTLERLGSSDVMQVVLAHKSALQTCTAEQKKKDPNLSGTLVMRWTILPSGKTTQVQARTDEFKSTYLATCIAGVIKQWTFPKHKVQGAPIDFPFKF